MAQVVETRNHGKTKVFFNNLKRGNLYIDKDDVIVLCTADGSVVMLETGQVISEASPSYNEFYLFLGEISLRNERYRG